MKIKLKLEVLKHLEKCLTSIHKNKYSHQYGNFSADWRVGYNCAIENSLCEVEEIIKDLKKEIFK